MKNTLSTSDIVNALLADNHAQWSYKAAKALAAYLEELETDCGIEMEFDAVALRCEFDEFESLEDWAEMYFTDDQLLEFLDGEELEDAEDKLRDYIIDHGQFIEFDGGVIVSQF